jgi:hypothetical protein
MKDIFEDIQNYLRSRNLQKSANLANLASSSEAAAAAQSPSSHFMVGGIPIPETALNTPEGLRLAMDWAEKQKQSTTPSFDPSNPFAWLQLRSMMENAALSSLERRAELQSSLMRTALQQRMMQQAFFADAAARRQQLLAMLMQSILLPALERYRIWMEAQRPPQPVIVAGGPQAKDVGSPLPQYVRVKI